MWHEQRRRTTRLGKAIMAQIYASGERDCVPLRILLGWRPMAREFHKERERRRSRCDPSTSAMPMFSSASS